MKLKCEYTCKICGKNILDEPDILDEHLISHKIPIELFWGSDNYDSESIYEFFYER